MKRIQWNEPRGYRRARYEDNERRDPKASLGFAALVFVLLLLVRLMAGLKPSPGAHPPSWTFVVPLCLVVAFFVAYILPRLNGLISVHVVIFSEKGINLNSVGFSKRFRFVPWDQISKCEFKKEVINGTEYSVVFIYDSDSIVQQTVAVDDKVDLEQVKLLASQYVAKVF